MNPDDLAKLYPCLRCGMFTRSVPGWCRLDIRSVPDQPEVPNES